MDALAQGETGNLFDQALAHALPLPIGRNRKLGDMPAVRKWLHRDKTGDLLSWASHHPLLLLFDKIDVLLRAHHLAFGNKL
ncbi:hypothetical protein D3C77_684150 [compost metagenome]